MMDKDRSAGNVRNFRARSCSEAWTADEVL
jgi:hypothetical protein